jgi:hypothetical protein
MELKLTYKYYNKPFYDGEVRIYKCDCGKYFQVSFGFYGCNYGRGSCECGAEIIIN